MMARPSIDDLAVFVTIGREGNFTRAAAKLGVSPSAVSQTLRAVEERLGVRLMTRSTRSVSLTEAGAKLFGSLGPMLDEIDIQLASLGDLRDRPAGTVRITADENASQSILWPALRDVLPAYPEIQVEIVTDYGLSDIVAERFDAGVRPGGIVDKDMIGVPIGPEMRMVVVCSPAYLEGRSKPRTPSDLISHRCINLRLPTYGGLFAWEFSRGKQELRVRVSGSLVFNSVALILQAALDGFGFAQLADSHVQPWMKRGELVEVLSDWSNPFDGYHLYYASRKQQTAAFRVVVDALRQHHDRRSRDKR